MNQECQHQWEPCAVVGDPGKFCPVCNHWSTINRSEFRQRFKRAFWRWHKEYCDAHVYGGYKSRKQSLRDSVHAGKLAMRHFGRVAPAVSD